MEQREPNKLKLPESLIQKFEQATYNTNKHHKPRKTQSFKTPAEASSECPKVNLKNRVSLSFKILRKSGTTQNLAHSKDNSITPSVPPRPSIFKFKKNVLDENDKREIRNSPPILQSINESKVDYETLNERKMVKKKSVLCNKTPNQTYFTNTLDELNFESKRHEPVKESNEHTKSTLIIKELISSEETYITNLEKILLYKSNFEKILPEDIKNNVIKDLFCNIEDIYIEHKEFYDILKRSKNEKNVSAAFILKESMFELYIPYARNKGKSDKIYNVFEERIKNMQQNEDRLDLSSYLLNPILRLGRYAFLLDEIEKLQNSQIINSSKLKIQNIMKRIKNYLAIDMIIELPPSLNLIEEGTFIAKESFKLLKPFSLDITAFLFQNVIVITIPRSDQIPECLYLKHFKLETVSFISREVDPLIFTLKLFDNQRHVDEKMSTYEFQARDPEIKQHWTEIFRKVLWEQFKAVKAAGM